MVGACSRNAAERLSLRPTPEITIVGVGDMLFARKLGVAMEQADDYTLPFRGAIADQLRAADIAVGNLEGPFCEKPPFTKEGMVFRTNPRAIESLLFAGFDAVTVANNHFGDGGDACMAFSLIHLKEAGILATGAGLTHAEAHEPAIVERKGIRFAFLGYTYADRNDTPDSTRPVISGRNPQNVQSDVAAALLRAHVVIVQLHDGAEYTRAVARETQEFARAAIEAGASVVLGHHPHVPQRIEWYQGGWIFYSLGNFIFLQNDPPETRHGLMARLVFRGAQLERAEAIPVIIEPPSTPRRATEMETARILNGIDRAQPVVFPGPWPGPN
jgi:poly-gamma-glutamate synthesis protein (capsule biosynthesis protein)